MTKINVSLYLQGSGRLPKFAALANVYDTTPNRDIRENLENLLIPSAPERPLVVDLSPGRYMVEAKLPSGKLLKKEVQVKKREQDVQLTLSSPHEWLGMQVLMGNVKQTLETPRHRGRPRDLPPLRADVKTGILSSQSPRVTPRTLRSKVYLESRRSKIERGYFFLLPEFQEEQTPHGEVSSLFPERGLRPDMSNDETDLFFLNLDRVQGQRYVSPDKSFEVGRPDFERLYLLTQVSGGSSQYSVLPLPWGLHDGGEADVEACVNTKAVQLEHSKNYDALHRISIVVKDDVFASLIGYLGSGDLPAASVILDRAKDMLFGKGVNPLASAAGAYVMLSQLDPDRREDWHEWIHNLRDFFHWLPDGAIQLAWLKLAQSESKVDEIRECLLEAYWRGLPYYSAGVKLLLDGLTIFSDTMEADAGSDTKIEDALKNVRQLAMRTDVNQPFTSVIIN